MTFTPGQLVNTPHGRGKVVSCFPSPNPRRVAYTVMLRHHDYAVPFWESELRALVYGRLPERDRAGRFLPDAERADGLA